MAKLIVVLIARHLALVYWYFSWLPVWSLQLYGCTLEPEEHDS
jgi:hypothetical protein